MIHLPGRTIAALAQKLRSRGTGRDPERVQSRSHDLQRLVRQEKELAYRITALRREQDALREQIRRLQHAPEELSTQRSGFRGAGRIQRLQTRLERLEAQRSRIQVEAHHVAAANEAARLDGLLAEVHALADDNMGAECIAAVEQDIERRITRARRARMTVPAAPLSSEQQRTLLWQLREGISSAEIAGGRMQLQLTKLRQEATRYETQARAALAAHRDDLARLAWQPKAELDATAQELQTGVEQLEAWIQELKEAERILRTRST